MTLQAGTTVGPYQVVAPIGAGGMGEVYRARDRKLDREVALKVLSAELSTSAEHLRRFEQEARAASALNHPNIIAIYDVGRIDSVSYIAMELVDGHDLRSMTAEAPIPLKRVLRIACKVADGLAAAHEKGIVHRDLKPENVIVSNEGFVKIVDFGLAKLVPPFSQTDTTRPHTSPGSVFGTVGYMSPEQASGKATDFRGDQFSFGVILFELVASQRPFERSTAAETMTAIIREDAPALPEGLEPVRERLEGILARCLAKDPRERYGSTRDLARDLREIRDAITRPADSDRRSGPLARKEVGRGLVSRVVAATALVAAVVAGGMVLRDYLRVPAPSVKSVAVLPFRNLGGAAVNQDFTDGLSETIAARLAEAPSLRVVAPFDGAAPSSMQSATDLARRRGVDVLLRGSVQHFGDNLRVTYAVIEGSTGRQMAGQTVTGPARDLFAFEDGVAEKILHSLGAAQAPVHRSTVTLTNPQDQKLFVEAIGLLQRPRDEKAIDGAIDRMETLLREARDSAPINALLSQAYISKYILTRKATWVEQASLYADRAIHLDPSLPKARVSEGQVKLTTGRYAEALAEFQRALNTKPDLYDAVLGMAQAHEALGHPSEADRFYARAISLRPDLPSPLNLYGRFCYSRGEYVRAVGLFQRVTEILPDSPRGFTNMGAAYQAMGRYDEAIAAYRRALSNGPNGVTWSNLGVCQFSLGRYSEAARSFEEATRLTPGDYVFWANLGDAYRMVPTESSKVVAAYQHALTIARQNASINPNDAVARAVTAGVLAKTGDLAGARREIDSALHLNPTDPNVLYQATIVALRTGDHDRATDWIVRAIRAGYGPSDAERDPDLGALRHDAAFIEAVQKAKLKS